jgi:hypothetical protein
MKIIPIIFLIFAHSTLSWAGTPPSSIPAQVKHILEYKCVRCHTEPLPSFGSLDLSHWVDTSDGRPGFIHLDAQKRQLPSRESFLIILKSILIETGDTQMPLGDMLKPDEKEAFESWLEEQISGT